MPSPRATRYTTAVRIGKKIRATIHTAFAHPDSSWSRNRSPTMLNRIIRYATNTKLMTMNQTTFQKVMAIFFHDGLDYRTMPGVEQSMRAASPPAPHPAGMSVGCAGSLQSRREPRQPVQDGGPPRFLLPRLRGQAATDA